jgi:MEKHLA domain
MWENNKIMDWTQILLDSYRRLGGSELIDRQQSLSTQSQLLYTAPFVVVSHDTQTNPVLNYGNRVALELWEMDWATFTATPSRQTAEPENQATRQQLLTQAQTQGIIHNYSGIRISSTGRRFQIVNATIWNLTNPAGQPCGQAATFNNWHFLP